MERTPSMVFSSTGQMHPEMITAIFMPSLMPTSSISTGTSTGGGSARKNSKTGSVTARIVRFNPTASPNTTPSTIAASTPITRRMTLGSTSVTIRSPNQVSMKVSTNCGGVGTKKFGSPEVAIHHQANRMTGNPSR